MNLPVRKRWQVVDGILLLDKPGGMSSNDALQKVRRLFSAAKAGHTGTLDPMATGLLPVCFGEATKFSNRLLESDKTYLATLRLGITTTTGDAEGAVIAERPVDTDAESVRAACSGFIGGIEQVPPMFSALKHHGKALYEYARQGIEVVRDARRVTIHALDVVRIALPEVEIRVCCSKGTYVRTLVEDIGLQLGCGAHLAALRRTGTGPLSVSDAVSLEHVAAMDEADRVTLLAPPDALLAHLPAVYLDPSDRVRFLHGQSVRCCAPTGEARVYGPDFLGLGCTVAEGEVRPVRLIASGLQGV